MTTFNTQIRTNKIPIKDLVPERSSTPPASPVEGQVYVDTSVTPNRTMVYENAQWVFGTRTGAELVANKGAANGYASLDAGTKIPIGQIPTGSTATTVVIGNDARLSDSRTPTGTAGGDLTGTYPNPTIAALAVTDAKVAAANKDGLAATPSMRTLGTGAQQAAAGNDARLSDTRIPTDASVTGGTAGAGVKIAANTITDANVALANKDGGAAVPSMRTLGTSATQAAAGNDSRFTDSRTPSGSAGGSLTGSYPNPTIAALAITDAMVAAANKDGAVGVASLRTLGSGAQQAMPGNRSLDQITAPAADVGWNSKKITSLADPVNPQDAATKNYVDLARQGIRLKDAVKAASTANLTLSGTQTVDGVALVANDRILVKDQTTAANNGIYTVQVGAWTRASDADLASELADGATTFVQQGTVNQNFTYAQINTINTLGTDAQSWVQQGAATLYLGGAGMVLNSQTFDIVAADGSITVNPDSITVGLVPVAKGGTNATTAAGARTNLGAVGKYAQDLGALTAGSEASVTHGLGTTDVTTSIRAVTGGAMEEFDVRVIDANTVGVTSGIAYSSGVYRIVVTG